MSWGQEELIEISDRLDRIGELLERIAGQAFADPPLPKKEECGHGLRLEARSYLWCRDCGALRFRSGPGDWQAPNYRQQTGLNAND